MRICLVHGAGATPLSWKSFQRDLGLETVTATYDVNDRFSTILERVGETAKDCDVVVGHSFGGIIAWHLAKGQSLKAGVSIAAPWGGSAMADVADLLTGALGLTSFFKNVGKNQPHMSITRKEPPAVPWLNVAATRGIFSGTENDGVISVESQEALCITGCSMARLRHSHNEILHSDELPRLVRRFLRITG